MQRPIDLQRMLFPYMHYIVGSYLIMKFARYEGATAKTYIPKEFNFGALDFMNGFEYPQGFGKMSLLEGYEISGVWDEGQPVLRNDTHFTFNGRQIPVFIWNGDRMHCLNPELINEDYMTKEDAEEWNIIKDTAPGTSIVLFLYERFYGRYAIIKDGALFYIGNKIHFIMQGPTSPYEFCEVLGKEVIRVEDVMDAFLINWDLGYWDTIGEDIAKVIYSEGYDAEEAKIILSHKYLMSHSDLNMDYDTMSLLKATTGATWDKFVDDCLNVRQSINDKDEFVVWVKCNLVNYTDQFKAEMKSN